MDVSDSEYSAALTEREQLYARIRVVNALIYQKERELGVADKPGVFDDMSISELVDAINTRLDNLRSLSTKM